MKKILRILSIIIITGVLACMVPLSACGAITTTGTTYTVSFDRGNISEDVTVSNWPDSQKIKKDEKASKPETDPSADGWTFNGWYTTSEATDTFDFDTTITANTTIYANWTEGAVTPGVTTYTVTFDLGDVGSTSDIADQTINAGETASRPADPTAEGYTFLGWYATASDNDTTQFDFTAAINGDTTIYAHWVKDSDGTTATVSIVTPEGVTVSNYNNTQIVGNAIAVPSSSQITNTTGKTISGWYVKYSGIEATEVIEGTTEVWDNCTLYPCFDVGLTLGLNSTNTSGFDYYTSATATAESGTVKAAYSVQPYFFENDFIAGKSITNKKAVSGDYFRITAAYSVVASTEYSFKYYLANIGEDEISFTLSQVTGGVDTATGASKDVTLASGEETTVILTLTPGENGNILPVVTVKNSDSEQVNFSLAMMVEPLSTVVTDTDDEQTTVASTVEITSIASSSNHDPIYYWTKGNVPYDSEYTTDYSSGTTAYDYCFMTPYLADNPTGGAVLVFAGGGYNYCSNSYGNNGKDNDGRTGEGNAIAKWFNAAGISVFVVNYRTHAVLNHNGIWHELLSDCSRAIRYLRYHAAEYNVDPDKIATCGYSAGGNMASLLLNSYEKFTIGSDSVETGYTQSETDKEIDSLSARADAGVFGYGVLGLTLTSNDGGTYSDGSTSTMFSTASGTRSTYCQYNNISADTAPCFIWQETNDDTVSSAYASTFAARLAEYNVPYELHLFNDTRADSMHGIGVAQEYDEAKAWPSMATNFLKALGF